MHARSMCLVKFGNVPESYVVLGHFGVVSAMVREQRSMAIPMANRLGRPAIPSKVWRFGFSVRWYSSCQSAMFWWCGCEHSHDSVLHSQALLSSVLPYWANVSARSFPLMFTCDGVHFPLIQHPGSCKILVSSMHPLIYSLPAVGPALNAFIAFWLPT